MNKEKNKENRELEHISAAKIKTNPLNTWSHGDLSALKASIRTYGVMEPLCVIGPDSKGEYTLLSGERRLVSTRQICKEDGISLEDCLMPCHIIDSTDMPKDNQLLYIETANLESRIDTPKEVINEHRAGVVKKLMEMCDSGEIPKRKLAGIASKYMQTSARYARYWTTVFSNGTDELQEMVSNAEVFPQDAAEIAHFDKKTQDEYIRRIKEGTSHKQIVNEIRENRKAEKRKKSTKKTYTMQELLEMELEEDDNIHFSDESDYNQDVCGGSFNSYRGAQPQNMSPGEYSDMLNMIIEWCEEIKMKENPTDEEWNAIYACGDIADKFL